MSWREIAEFCYIRHGRRSHHKYVKRIATVDPPLSLQARRYQPWHQIPDPAERKGGIIRLHSGGWLIALIAQHRQVSRQTIYRTLQRWMEEGVGSLDEKSRARKGSRMITLSIASDIFALMKPDSIPSAVSQAVARPEYA